MRQSVKTVKASAAAPASGHGKWVRRRCSGMYDSRDRLLSCLNELTLARTAKSRRDLADRCTSAAVALADRAAASGDASGYHRVAAWLAATPPAGMTPQRVQRAAAALRAAQGPGAGPRLDRLLGSVSGAPPDLRPSNLPLPG